MTKALSTIRLVGNLASYSFDPADAVRITTALSEAVREVEIKFKGRQRSERKAFDL